MITRLHSLVLLAATVAGFAASGCGSSSLPSSASSSPALVTPSAPGPQGATINGTVNSGAAAASTGGVHAQAAAGIRVTVTGTGLSGTTDGRGRFILKDVPSGRVELRFEGKGIDARLSLAGLQEGQSIDINVRLSGSEASLEGSDGDNQGDNHDEVELKGAVQSVTPPSLKVGGRTVMTNASTKIVGKHDAPIPLTDIHPGDKVEVKGTAQADGSVLATRVKLDDENDGEDEQEVELDGKIEAKSTSSIKVSGRTVMVDASTRVLDRKNNPIAFSVLKVGDGVEVEGKKSSTGDILATKIKLDD